ncbi:PREDICTED: BPI fold-containing family A member 2-like, partial [Myotis davidii]|uniref:BPI fold-containing family A member 2-like n=1 Tax=Myotis davidii TaxID=225400 RepID=UPI000766E957
MSSVLKSLRVDDRTLALLQKLKEDISLLQDSNAWKTIQEKFDQTKDLLNGALSKIFKGGQAFGVRGKVLFTLTSTCLLGEFWLLHRLKFSNVRILNFKAEPTPDGQGLRLRYSTSADVSLTLPLVRKAVHLNVSLDLLATVQIETDPKTGGSRVVMTECASDPDSISFTLLGEHSKLVNKLSGTLSSFLSDTVS